MRRLAFNPAGLRGLLSIVLSGLLLITCPGVSFGQQAPAAPAPAPAPQSGLRIVIVEGEGAINNVRQRVARELVVEVRDEQDRPVVGAIVSFASPGSGPSGTFADGSRLFSAVTDETGRAVAGYTPNEAIGGYNIEVSASYQGQAATITIPQLNALGAAATAGAAAGGAAIGSTAGGITATTIGIIAGIAAAVTVGVVAATKNGKNGPETPATPVRIGIGGSPSIGIPQP